MAPKQQNNKTPASETSVGGLNAKEGAKRPAEQAVQSPLQSPPTREWEAMRRKMHSSYRSRGR